MNKNLWYFIFLVEVLISSISQIILKKSTQKKYPNKIREYLNRKVIFSYFLFFGATFIALLAYQWIPLSSGLVLEAMGYVFIGILSHFILKEKVTLKKIFGMLCIILGIIIMNIP